jgi:hypothetical protein|nr:MAG TPA: hypothetical protein [Bacteriophage sp.]
MIDFDCGSATFNGVANNNWDSTANMIKWYSYYEMYKKNILVDLALSINKSLNNDVIWLVSDDKTNWTVYVVYGESYNIITINLYDDSAIHSDGYGVNGGDKFYIACKIGDKINDTATIFVNRS